jgi:hypothetical protein
MNKFMLLAAVALVACSDDSPKVNGSNNTTNNATNNATNNTTNNATNNTTNNATNNNTTVADMGTDMPIPVSPCPETAPTSNETCDRADLACEYGDDPRDSCRIYATCDGTGWQVVLPRCTPLPDAICPATRADAEGELCDAQDAWCKYDDGLNCECTNCMDGPVIGCAGDPIWRCAAPNTNPMCPAAKPALGEVCLDDDQICNYKCGPGNGRTCVDAVWQSSDGGPCPISTRDAKTDIEYLTPKQVKSLAGQVQALKIASWRYTDVALQPTKTRFGIIIEDAPGSPAVDTRSKMVDLYGLSSLLLADAQAKDLEIQDLKKRLEALERRLNKDKK